MPLILPWLDSWHDFDDHHPHSIQVDPWLKYFALWSAHPTVPLQLIDAWNSLILSKNLLLIAMAWAKSFLILDTSIFSSLFSFSRAVRRLTVEMGFFCRFFLSRSESRLELSSPYSEPDWLRLGWRFGLQLCF